VTICQPKVTFFQILLKFFHLQSYVSTTRTTKMSEKLLPQQGGNISMSLAVVAETASDISMSFAVSAHFTHPTKEWFLTSMPRAAAKFVARL